MDCKTVKAIETEIKDAQNYLVWADQHYDKKRYSPSEAEYKYIKRLVDDGQPIVLSKQIRKALNMKDEHQTLDKAIRDDLLEAGLKQSEIAAHLEGQDNANNPLVGQAADDDSDVDSADRRKRKMMLQAKGQKALKCANGQQAPPPEPVKHLSKNEKAR